MSRGNPKYMEGLRERRAELLERLRNNHRDTWESVKAAFAIEFAIREETVDRYYRTLKKAGLLEEGEDNG